MIILWEDLSSMLDIWGCLNRRNTMSKMPPDKSNSGQQDDWGPCPQGELQHMVERIKSQRRRRRVVRISSLSSALVLIIAVGAVGFYFLQAHQPMVTGDVLICGVACNDVRENMVAYVKGDLEKQDPDLSEKMFMHIVKCNNCRVEERKVKKDLRSKKPTVAAAGQSHSPLLGILLTAR